MRTAPASHGREIEDHFWIERIEPGKLWLKPLTAGASVIGPVPVPKKVTALCQPMWDIGGVVAKDGGRMAVRRGLERVGVSEQQPALAVRSPRNLLAAGLSWYIEPYRFADRRFTKKFTTEVYQKGLP